MGERPPEAVLYGGFWKTAGCEGAAGLVNRAVSIKNMLSGHNSILIILHVSKLRIPTF